MKHWKVMGASLALSVLVVTVVGCASWFQPTTTLSFSVGETINPDSRDRPSPVVVRVHELSADDAFRDVDFFALYDDPNDALGESLLHEHEQMLRPGDPMDIALRLDGSTRYIGVLVAFQAIDEATWRVVIPANPHRFETHRLKLEKLELVYPAS